MSMRYTPGMDLSKVMCSEHVFKTVKRQATVTLPEHMRSTLKLDVLDTVLRDRLVLMVSTLVPEAYESTILGVAFVPRDWWQHFKDRWFPGWLLERFPVRHRAIDIETKVYRVCGHTPAQSTPDFLRFMVTENPQ